MAEDLQGVATTALLVNESRARRIELSQDRFAEDWIPASRRGAVRDLWDDFARAVYPHDDIVVSVRGRAVIEALRRAWEADPEVTLLSLGAGFTSYTWLIPFARSIEVDLPEIVHAKQARAEDLNAAGVLPDRDVLYVAVDLAEPAAPATIRHLVGERVPPSGSVAIVIEGLLYYLPPASCEQLLSLPATLERSVSTTIVSYWPSESDGHPVLRRQARWFAKAGVPTDATLLSTDAVRSALGGGVAVDGPAALQRRFGQSPVVPEADLVPEYVAERSA